MESSFVLSIHVYINNVQVGEELSGGQGVRESLPSSRNSLSREQEGEVWFQGRVSRVSLLLASRRAGGRMTGEETGACQGGPQAFN